MRKVFSSQRLENVEAVAELLKAEGIAVRITNGRSYRSSRRSTFSYDSRRMPEELPSVWIVYSEDQPRGRQLLRELGLMESTREPGAGYLPTGRHREAATPAGLGGRRLKLGLLLAIAGGIALIVYASRTPAPAPQVASAQAPPAAPAIVPAVALTEVQVFRIDVPTALAAKLVGDALEQQHPAQACLQVDGGDPSPKLLQALPAGPTRLFPASACPDTRALTIAVRDYMTDGSGRGEVSLQTGTRMRTLQVQRNGRDWSVSGAH